jgi:uncharacterized membrane protein YbhN (UPF0104 family)
VLLVFTLTIFLMALPFLPGGLGAFEGGMAGTFELLGRSRAEGLAYAVTVHASEMTVVVAGFLVLGRLGIRLTASGGGRAPLNPRAP